MRIILDSVISQVGGESAASRWRQLLQPLTLRMQSNLWTVIQLDRGRAPAIEGAVAYPFPDYRFSEGAADSALLQKFCDFLQADVFVSSAFTTPLSTSTVQLLISDSLPIGTTEPLSRADVERQLALAFSTTVICDSEVTRRKLTELGRASGVTPLISLIDWQTATEPEQLNRFCDLAIDRIAQAKELASTQTDRQFRTNWRRLREMQAAVDVI
jgi:hypothetical protein